MSRPAYLIRLFCTLLVMHSLFAMNIADAATDAAIMPASGYAIVLASSPGKNLAWTAKESPLFETKSIYVEQATIKNAPWERLCLGFFENRDQANAQLKDIQKIYPGAWIQKSSAKNIALIIKPAMAKPAIANKTATKPGSLTEKQLDSLMKRAKSDLAKGNIASAIRYLTALTDTDGHKYYREALELLGLARQRKGQNAHAVDIYEKYLVLYPDGESSDRVRQRLAGLLTANSAPRDKIRMSSADTKDEITSYGSLSQFYLHNKTATDDLDRFTTLSRLISYMDLTTLQRSSKFDHRYQFTADHNYDFLDSRDNNQFRFIETYYELSYRKTGTSGRFGRQTLRIGGAIKRFDGLSAGYQITPDMRINLLGGFPVDIDNKTSINRSKTFYGFTFETGTFLQNWDMNIFYFDQKVDGINDRRSTGTEVHYRDDTKFLFGMIDYDLFFKEVNMFQLNANVMFDHGRTIYMNAYMRKSPTLATSNALIGQQERSIEELKKTLNIEQIYQLARDRTSNSYTVTVGGSAPVSEKFTTTADITLIEVDGTVASGDVAAVAGTGTDYFLSAQLVGNSIFMTSDTAVLGLRYYDTHTSNTTSLITNTRFPITRTWRINPRLQFDFRKSVDGRSQKKLRFILKTDFRYLNKARFDFEVGYDKATEDNDGLSLGSNNLFLTLGYRWDF